MNKSTHNKTPAQMVETIFSLDLEQIKSKLMNKKEGYGWTREEADRNELEYKRYLALLAKFPDETIAPTVNADKFWHGHILDTMRYAKDCEEIFGYFLHHYPYFGLRGEQDAANLEAAAKKMRQLYQQEFGASGASAAYCAKATDKVAAAGEEAAYCAVSNVSYCAKATDEVAAAGEEAAYCAAANVSYCAKATDKVAAAGEEAAYCAVSNVSYCAKATDKVATAGEEAAYCAVASVSYCAKATDKVAAAGEEAAYCAATNVAYCAKASDKLAVAGEEAAYCAAASVSN